MRIQLRTRVIAGVAVALVLSLPAWSSANASAHVPARSATGYSHARALRLLEQVRAALSPRPGSARASRPAIDLTLTLRELRLAMPALSRTERATANTYLARPSLGSGCSGTVVVAGHFCVHYTAQGLLPDPNATTDAQAQLTADTLANVWNHEIGTMGFRAPPADSDGLFDVYLQELGNQGLYGYCAPDTSNSHSTSYCVLDNDFDPSEYGGAPATSSLDVTAAHEFFHAVQFGYDTGEDIWFMEGTAVWAEEQVYPRINDYLQYLPYSAITHPRTPADYNGVDGSSDLFFRYGAVLFWKFLSGRFDTTAIVRRVWEYADAATPGNPYSVRAVADALAERGWSFARAFGEFGEWNTEPAGSYDDRGLYPAPAWWRVAKLTRHRTDTGSLGVSLDHLTNAALVLQPGARLPRHTRLRIRVNAPSLVHAPRALVQVRRTDGRVTLVVVPLDGNGDGAVRVGFDPRLVRSVVVTLSNASIRMRGCGTDASDRYSCAGSSLDDDQVFGVRARVRLP